MFRELLSIFRTGDPLSEMGKNFNEMLRLAHELNISAARIFFGESGANGDTEEATLYELDARVNALEQTIRRQVVTHLSVPGNETDVPYSLLLMTLVKDVERLGDYGKNLAQIVSIRPEPLPSGPCLDELLVIRRGVERVFEAVSSVFRDGAHDEAMALIRDGRAIARKCDQLIVNVGKGSLDAGTTTALILGTRYYKRIGGHLLNVLSSVVMPLDKVDYYDEPTAPDGR